MNPTYEISPLQIVAHSLKHPLAVLKANLQILQDSPQEDVMTLCLRQVDRMNQLIGEILLPGKENEPCVSRFNLNDLLKEVIIFSKPLYESHFIDVQHTFSPLPYLEGKKTALFHAFLNLLTNALEACPSHTTISLSTEMKGTSRIVVIRDLGVGIDPLMLEHIFSPFFTTKPNGNGLGLAIANEIIQNHGGSIAIDSEQGKGTTLRIRFPLNNSKNS